MYDDARVLQIFVTAADRRDGRPLYEAIVEACRTNGIAGVTVLRDVEGFDDATTIVRDDWLHHDESVVVIVVDRADRVDHLAELVTPWLAHGIVTRADARARRVERGPGSTAPR